MLISKEQDSCLRKKTLLRNKSRIFNFCAILNLQGCKYYCKDCKFGSNYESIYNKHITTLNHKKMIAYKNKC